MPWEYGGAGAGVSSDTGFGAAFGGAGADVMDLELGGKDGFG